MSASSSSTAIIHRGLVGLALAVSVAMATVVADPAFAGESRSGPSGPNAGGRLQIYYRSPVLVRPGERIRIPVDVACTTAAGRPCRATVSLGTVGASRPWREIAARARPGLRFDISAPAARASAIRGFGAVSYSLSARGAGQSIALPPARHGALRLYVARHMPRIGIPRISFGATRKGGVALYLPWGTGPRRAGLSPGNESVTIGPSSFDVDRRGRIHLLDALHRRIAVFRRGRLLREIPVMTSPAADIAVTSDGTTFVAAQTSGRVGAEAVSPAGRMIRRWNVGPGILAEVRTSGNEGFLHLLPLDAWIRLGPRSPQTQAGLRQASGGLLLSSVVGRSIRLGLARRDRVHGAVELRPRVQLGELALAAGDGSGGYLTVFRIMRDGPQPDEEFQAVHLKAGGTIDTFGISDRGFADPMAYSRFRLGGDGNLYQLATFPDGMRILRYDLRGES